MTKVMMNIDRQGNIMFDCHNHAEDYNVCTIISTLCDVLVESCLRYMDDPKCFVDGVDADAIESDVIDFRESSVRISDNTFDISMNKGDVRIDVSKAQSDTTEIFEVVMRVMKQAAEQHPEFIKIY